MIPWRQSEPYRAGSWGRLRSICRSLSNAIRGMWRAANAWRQKNSRVKQLRLRESLSFGERRFVAVVEFEQRQFLIGGTGTSISMLAELTAPDNTKATVDQVPAAKGAA